MIELFDSHAHLTSEDVYGELETLLCHAKLAGVENIVNICTDLKSLERGLELVHLSPSIYHAGATTPHDVHLEGETMFSHFANAARQKKLLAIGETGLDYYYWESTKDIQQHFLCKYLRLAIECQLPVIIHCREAFSDLFKILDKEYSNGPGLLHCFTGTSEEAEELVRRGWMISFSGIVTYKKSDALRAILQKVPESHLLIETDTPYLAPQSKRGTQNEPAFLLETAKVVAGVRGISLEELALLTTTNAKKFFRIGA